jgi:thiol-disulfide isomerase/thioredoxin
MKKLFLISLLHFSLPSFSQVSVSGEIKNAAENTEVSISYYNNYIEYVEITSGKTKIDRNGTFSMQFTLSKATEANLFIGTEYSRIFLVPGDSLHITADFAHFDETLMYSGRGSADNNYLAVEMLADFRGKGNRYNEFTDGNRYALYMDSLELAKKEFFKHYDNLAFSPEFRSYITANNKYDFINPRWMFQLAINPQTRRISSRPVPEHYFDFLNTLDINDQEAAENISYVVSLQRYLSEKNDATVSKTVPDSLSKEKKTEWRISKNYAYRKKIFTGKVLDKQLTDFVKSSIPFIATDKKFADEFISDYKKTCRNPEYISIIENIYLQAITLAPGQPAPAFTLTDAHGKSVSLSSLKGKMVFIDFWATWCAPCLMALPNTRALANKFKDRDDVAFLYVNITDEQKRWKNFILKEKMEGIQVFANEEESANLHKMYNFDGIPHCVLIDKQGNILDAMANTADAEKSIQAAKE